jgi:hypothetical protein
MNYFLYSFGRLVTALFFILIGIVGILIPWSIQIRHLLARFIFEDFLAISLFGFAFFVVGLALVIHFLLGTKRRYYKISSGTSSTAVDETVIREYLTTYWERLFPEYDIPFQLFLKDNKIHVTVDFPYLPIQEQRPLLERVRNDLTKMFIKVLGYKEEFFLSASFQTTPPTPSHEAATV